MNTRREMPPIPHRKEYTPEPPTRIDDATAEQRIKKLDMEYMMAKISPLTSRRVNSIRSVIESLARLVIELEDQIPNYDTILSDDASGRLVSIFLREIINKKRKELGRPPAQTFFLASGKHVAFNFEPIQEFIRQKKSSVHKALLVTEIIMNGDNINALIKLIEKEGIDFDVATVSTAKPIDNYRALSSLIKRIRYGDEHGIGMEFYRNAGTGVIKGNEKSAHPVKDPNASRLEMKRVRQDMKLMAGEIYKLIA